LNIRDPVYGKRKYPFYREIYFFIVKEINILQKTMEITRFQKIEPCL
jgi:hypothetical protein